MAAANLRHADAWLLRLLHRPFLLATEATGGSTAGPLLAISSDTYTAQLAAALNRTRALGCGWLHQSISSPDLSRRSRQMRSACGQASWHPQRSPCRRSSSLRYACSRKPKRNRTTVRAHAVAIPHPSGNAVVGRAVTGMKIKGMPTFRTRALSGLTNSQQDRAIDRRKRLSTGVTFARPVDGRL